MKLYCFACPINRRGILVLQGGYYVCSLCSKAFKV